MVRFLTHCATVGTPLWGFKKKKFFQMPTKDLVQILPELIRLGSIIGQEAFRIHLAEETTYSLSSEHDPTFLKGTEAR